MKIIYLSHRIPFPADKGEKIRTFHQLKYLLAQGFDITVFSPVNDDNEALFAEQLEQALPLRVVTARLGAAWLRKVKGLVSQQALSVSHFYAATLAQQLKAAIQHSKPDAIVCTSSAMACYVEPLLQQKIIPPSCRLLMDFMDLDSDKWQQYAEKASGIWRWIYQREARLIAQAELSAHAVFDHCFFISENETSLFCARGATKAKVSVLANGIDTGEFYPSPKPLQQQAPVFLFTGVMDYLPNEDAVLWFVKSCWEHILQRWPQAQFIIAGMQPSQKIQQLARLKGITVTGYVNDILPYYHQADVFVAPFRLARGVQNKILQAMACGLPVVTTTLGAEGIACEQGEHILLADNEQDIIAQVSALLTDPALYAKLQQNGPALIQQQYSWEGVLQALPKLLAGTA